jgi:DNA repair protein RecN (Recombination protein N)
MQLDDLNKLRPLEAEETLLLEKRQSIAGFAKIADTVSNCLKGLTYPKDLAAEIGLHQQTLVRSNNIKLQTLEDAAKGLDRAYIEIKEVQQLLQDLLEEHQDHAYQLQTYDQRYSEIHTISKKYGISGDELHPLWLSLQKQGNNLDDPEHERNQLQKQVSQMMQQYINAAKILSNKRMQAAEVLEKAVLNELPDLFLPHARFRINLQPLAEGQWGPTGIEQVIFEVCMNPGQPFSALHKTASGGEMARLMLALKVVTSTQKNLATQIFDEIDQGVSGSIALAIGKRLRRLGNCGQVMAITHSAQVASQAQYHLVVQKEQRQTTTNTNVLVLGESERVNEIARMLSGHEINDVARQAAIELMKE